MLSEVGLDLSSSCPYMTQPRQGPHAIPSYAQHMGYSKIMHRV